MTTERPFNWPEAAERLQQALAHRDVRLRWPESVPGLQPDSVVGVACSGGLDSTVALIALWADRLWPREQLRVLHFNHHVRGDAADRDEAYTTRLAQGLCLPCTVGHRGLERNTELSEASLREDRFHFFRETGIRHIVTGHHFQDVLETFLMRLGRGSALEGLLRPEWISHHGDFTFIRPLIDLSRETLLAAAREAGITWCEDDSNRKDDYLRNRIRKKLIPAWKSLFPEDQEGGLRRSLGLLREDETGWKQLLDESQPEGAVKLDMDSWLLWPKALRRRALWRWLKAVDAVDVFSAEGFETWMAALEQGKTARTSLGHGHWSVVRDGCLQMEMEREDLQWQAQALHPGICLYLPHRASLEVERVPMDAALRKRLESGDVDCRKECFLAEFGKALGVRLRQPGDRYQPLGAPGRKKLKDALIDRKIGKRERDRLPVVCMGPDPVWCPGLPPAESCRVTMETEWALRLTYRLHC